MEKSLWLQIVTVFALHAELAILSSLICKRIVVVHLQERPTLQWNNFYKCFVPSYPGSVEKPPWRMTATAFQFYMPHAHRFSPLVCMHMGVADEHIIRPEFANIQERINTRRALEFRSSLSQCSLNWMQIGGCHMVTSKCNWIWSYFARSWFPKRAWDFQQLKLGARTLTNL